MMDKSVSKGVIILVVIICSTFTKNICMLRIYGQKA